MLHYNSLSPSLFLQFAPEADLRLQHGTVQGSPWPKVSVPMPTFALGQAGKKLLGGSTQGMSTKHLSACTPTQNNRMRESKAQSSPLELSSSWASHHTLLQLWKGKVCQELFQLCSGEKFQLFLGQSASQESAQVLLCSNIQTPGFSTQRQMTKYIRII